MYSIFEQLLQKHGVTTYKVSKELGISQSVFSNWKNGLSTPKLDKLQSIADYFGVSIDFLMGTDKVEKTSQFEAKNDFERDMLLLCRKVEESTPEVQEVLKNQFKSSLDIYLKAKGLI